MAEKSTHISLEEQVLCDDPKYWKRSRKRELVTHLSLTRRNRLEKVIMLHELEGSLNHCVLEIVRRVEGRDLACQILTHTEVLGAPPYEIIWAHEARRHASYGLLPGPLCP